MTDPSRLKPIGYYLKHLDTLINHEFEEGLAGRGLTRRHWQVLHNLATAGPHEAAALAEKLRPFWGEGAITLDEVTADLAARGWIEGRPYAATAAGVQAHAEIERQVSATRARLMTGLTDEDYLAAVTVLARMCRNLESAA